MGSVFFLLETVNALQAAFDRKHHNNMSHKNRWDVFWYNTIMNVLYLIILDEESSGPSEQI